MRTRRTVLLIVSAALLNACGPSPQPGKLTVAAAANLTDVFAEIGRAFRTTTGTEAVFVYGSTAALAQQIENGAPYDIFAAADVEHVDALIAKGKLARNSRAIYALGQLAVWAPGGDQIGLNELKNLAGKEVRFVAVAKPELAPYGQAAVEALKNSNLWDTLQPRIVYANNINEAKQLAASGNADAAFTAYSLVLHERGTILRVDSHLYRPIQQAVAILSASTHPREAELFHKFLLGEQGRTILAKSGYLLPQ
jgi:molybdate transport system substrate-binding protein